MINSIDHVVVVTRTLDDAVGAYRAAGFVVRDGGSHLVQETRNALIPFGCGAYIELITFTGSNPRHRWWPTYLAGGGLTDICLGSTDLVADRSILLEDIAVDAPKPLARLRPDGIETSWQLAIPAPEYQRRVPFMISDETPRELRVPHAPGQPYERIDRVEIVDESPALGRQTVSRLGASAETANAESNMSIRLESGAALDFVSGDDDAPSGAWLRERGSSPWRALLSGPDVATWWTDRGHGPELAPALAPAPASTRSGRGDLLGEQA